jgi:hypothetical protein
MAFSPYVAQRPLSRKHLEVTNPSVKPFISEICYSFEIRKASPCIDNFLNNANRCRNGRGRAWTLTRIY